MFINRSSIFSRISDDYKRKLGGYLTSSKQEEQEEELERFINIKIKGNKYSYVDAMVRNEESFFNSLDIIVNNSNYNPEYLQKIYIIEFYRILRAVEKKIRKESKKYK